MSENNQTTASPTERRVRGLVMREPREIPKAQRVDWVFDQEGVGDDLLEH